MEAPRRTADQVRSGQVRTALIDEFARLPVGDVAALTRALERAWTALIDLGPRVGRAVELPLQIPG